MILSIEVLLFAYFIGTNAFYVWTACVALAKLPGFMKRHFASPARSTYSRFEPPVSIVVPAFNEAEGILGALQSLLNLAYPCYEIIVVDDGSTDGTLELLSRTFGLERSSEPYRIATPTQRVRAIYRSKSHPILRVVEKHNGGKGDALNAGVNCASYPLIFCADGDSYYVPETLTCMVEPFLADPRTVVSAGTIGVASGCDFRDGKLERVRLSRSLVVQFQVLEYLRAFLASRLGWAPINALGVVSGACGLYRKEILVQAGGFRTDTIWEDMEMTIRVHHVMRARKQPYRIAFTPVPVCFTMVPPSWRALWRQRIGWHRHVSEVMAIHRKLLFARRGGAIGWIGLPYLLAFEWFAPIAVLLGITLGGVGLYYGFLSIWSQEVLLFLTLGLSLIVSVAAVLLDGISFDSYAFPDVLRLLLVALIENVGFRQVVTVANLVGICRWAFARRVQGRPVGGVDIRVYDPVRSANWRHT
jgi:cellulose synthase/poly-beta-1,6-N-acetylglucosamine synthase-like glycosyltransferase